MEGNATEQQLKMGLLPILVNGLVNTTILILGALLILKGELSVGMLLAFQGFMSSFLSPVNDIVNASKTIVVMRSQMERIEDVMKFPEDHRENEGEMFEGKLGGLVELKNVTFGYSTLQPPLIENVNLPTYVSNLVTAWPSLGAVVAASRHLQNSSPDSINRGRERSSSMEDP